MGMNVDPRFAPYRIQRSTQALNARVEVTFSRTGPKEILFVFDGHSDQGFDGWLAENESDMLTGFQSSHNETVRFQIKTFPSEFSRVRNAKARVEQQQNQSARAKSVPLASVERVAGNKYGVDSICSKGRAPRVSSLTC